jgi:excisionase family DNA binding protein
LTTATLTVENPRLAAYFTIKEAANHLGTTESHVRSLVSNGTIPAAQLGRLWRIRRSALEERLDELASVRSSQSV